MKQITDEQYKQYQAICKAAGIYVKDIEPKKWKPEKWKPEKQQYFFNLSGEVLNNPLNYSPKYGVTRSTTALCKIASDRTIRANLISAWLDEFGSGEQEYDNNKNLNYIYYNEDKWQVGIISNCYFPDKVYMTLKDAEALCKALNEGIVNLHGL